MQDKLKTLHETGECKSEKWDDTVFAKTRMMLGGNQRMLVIGSVPIKSEILDFIKIAMCTTIVEGYGLTETSSASTITEPSDPKSGHIGAPMTNTELKLVDIPEMNYLTSGEGNPRGELCIRGSSVMKGYYKRPDLNDEVFKDGWFYSGDVAEFLPNGTVQIIDRKKNIFKLSQGVHIAPEKLENVYNKSRFVDTIFVHGEPLQSYLVAIISPDMTFIPQWAEKAGVPIEDMCTSEKLKEEIFADFEEKAKEANLNGLERIKKIHLTDKMFTVENGLLTSAMKLIRHKAKIMFQEQIDTIYAD